MHRSTLREGQDPKSRRSERCKPNEQSCISGMAVPTRHTTCSWRAWDLAFRVCRNEKRNRVSFRFSLHLSLQPSPLTIAFDCVSLVLARTWQAEDLSWGATRDV